MEVAGLGLRIEAGQVIAATGALDKLTAAGGRAEGTASRITRAFGGLGLAIGGGLLFRSLLRETVEAQNAMAQLEAAVHATGGAAGRTVPQLTDLASALQRTTIYSDEAVMGAQSLLLTFDKISGATFDRATRAVTDLAARMGGDLSGAAMQLGKALQEPATGLSMLRRAGLTFDEAQVAVIKHLAETGRLAEAQALILTELESRFRGSAEAARNTLGGALAGLKNAFGDLLEISRGGTGGIIGALNGITRALTENADAIRATAKVAALLGGAFALSRIGAVADIFVTLRLAAMGATGVLPALGAGLAALATPITVLTASLAAFYAIYRLYKDVVVANAGERPTAAQSIGGAWARAQSDAARRIGRALDPFGLTAPPVHAPAITREAAAVKELANAYKTLRTAIEQKVAAQEAERTKIGEVADANRTMWDAMRELAQRGIEAAKASAEAWGETVQSIKAAIREMKQGAGSTLRGIAGALPTVMGIDLGRLLTSPKSYALDLFAKALDNIFNGAARAAAALRAFALNMESFRAAMTGDQLAQAIAAVRQQAQALRDELFATVRNPDEFRRAMDTLREIGELEEKRIQQLREEFAAAEKLAKITAVKDIIAALTGTITTLRDYAASLKLGPSSVLNPMAQYAEARRQYDLVLAAAQGGDQAAAGRLPAAAQAFLDASRAVNASGVAYARDYAAVQAAVDAVAGAFEAQRSIQQQILDELVGIRTNTDPIPTWGGGGGGGGGGGAGGGGGGGGGNPDQMETVPPILVAGFTAVVDEVALLCARVDALIAETRHTGERLAVT